ncbi:MAG TPA: methyltransferase domain-containing protein [Rhizomicrobium sp.]
MTPACRHFGTCGGCTLYGLGETEYRARKRDGIVAALAKHGVAADIGDAVRMPSHTRRRAVFRIVPRSGGIEIGFHAHRTHDVVDMRECLVLTPGLFALVDRLRAAMTPLLADGQRLELHVTEAENGFDLAFRAQQKLNPTLTAALAAVAPALDAVRITWNAVLAFERAAPFVRFGKASVKLPPDSFLQPTRQGEDALRARVLRIVKGAKSVADLFCGCGTFSLSLAEQARVHAVEREPAMLDALAAAARAAPGLRPVTVARRDLFKLPLTAPELNGFDAVVLDPPRAGAEGQVRQLAQSKVPRLAYVSCDAASFARDAAILVDGGYRIGTITPVDQFLWSSHIELVAGFARGR